jgi:hypothetical protein
MLELPRSCPVCEQGWEVTSHAASTEHNRSVPVQLPVALLHPLPVAVIGVAHSGTHFHPVLCVISIVPSFPRFCRRVADLLDDGVKLLAMLRAASERDCKGVSIKSAYDAHFLKIRSNELPAIPEFACCGHITHCPQSISSSRERVGETISETIVVLRKIWHRARDALDAYCACGGAQYIVFSCQS